VLAPVVIDGRLRIGGLTDGVRGCEHDNEPQGEAAHT
jgi:hypothetical protein